MTPSEIETDILKLQPGTIFKTMLCVSLLTPAQITLQEKIIHKILHLYVPYMGMNKFRTNRERQDSLISHVIDKINEYSDLIACLGKKQPYCAQLLLENTIMVLDKEYSAPAYVLNKLQESV